MAERMKLLTVAVPCFNAEGYMRRAVDSALVGGEDVEILIVNDGSTDGTGRIADDYERQYPGAVRVVHQANKGHGGAVMTGLKHANGLYFKVLDADDWLDAESFPRLLDALKTNGSPDELIDMFISNYVYDKVNMKRKREVGYGSALPVNRVFGWDEVGRFRKGQYVLMHSVVYRTQLLRDAELKLPEKSYYVDNLYVYDPIVHVKRMYYLSEPVYHYFIGREDQSVHEGVMIRHIGEQLRVNRRMFADVDLSTVPNKRTKRYLLNYLEIVTAVSSVLLIRSGTKEHLAEKDRLWADIKRDYPAVWRMLRFRIISAVLQLPGAPGRRLMLMFYAVTKRIYGYN